MAGAFLGGAGAAVCWAGAFLLMSPASRAAGPVVLLAWVMLTGSVVTAVALPFADTGGLDASAAAWLAVAGVTNVVGLLAVYAALRIGRVAAVSQVVATEGLAAALLAAALGESLALTTVLLLVPITLGVVLAAGGTPPGAERADEPGRAAGLAVTAALLFGLNLVALGRGGADTSLIWAVVPARAVGLVALALPLAVRGRMALPRRVVPLVVAAGLLEVLGIVSYTAGSRSDIAIAAVLATQYPILGALGARLAFGERLHRRQVAGIALSAVALGALAATTA